MEFQKDYTIAIDNLKDLTTTIFVIVDDLYHENVPGEIKYRLHWEKAKLSDSEIIAISIVGELMSIDSENAWVRYVRKNMRDLFPRMCERSRFNRLRRNLMSATELIRTALSAKLEFTQSEYRIVDSFPLAVCEFGRAKFTNLFKYEEASYGHCPSKKETYFGYKVHALCTTNGYISDILLTPASTDDRDAIWELIEEYNRHLKLIGDKGYVGVEFARDLLNDKGVTMIAMKRTNAKNPDPKPVRQAIFKVRRRIETSFSQLDDMFNIESTCAKSLWGLVTRLRSKILAFNICFAINWLAGRRDNVACVKSLVF